MTDFYNSSSDSAGLLIFHAIFQGGQDDLDTKYAVVVPAHLLPTYNDNKSKCPSCFTHEYAAHEFSTRDLNKQMTYEGISEPLRRLIVGLTYGAGLKSEPTGLEQVLGQFPFAFSAENMSVPIMTQHILSVALLCVE